MFHRPLICTDLSDGLQRFADFIPQLAASGFQEITFQHSVPLPSSRAVPKVDEALVERARVRLTPAAAEIPANVKVQVDIAAGRAIDQILAAIRTHAADLLILGTQSRSLLNERLFGSTTIALCQRANIPLLILRPQLLAAYTKEEFALRCQHLLRDLLIPYDGSRAADYAIAQIKHYAQTRSAGSLETCRLRWVLEDTGRRALREIDRSPEAKQKLATVQAELAAFGLKVDAEVLKGELILELLLAAQEADVSAIALSSTSLGKLIEVSAPSFAGELLRRCWCPILYFPPAS